MPSGGKTNCASRSLPNFSDELSLRIAKILSKKSRWKFSAFTLAELIVVVTILAILATVGFISLSGYAKDAADSRAKANVRSIYSAISAESAVTGNSPRYYVIHSPSAELSGGFVTFDVAASPVILTGGDWNAPGTNYSAGNPDFVKLKLNPEKFKVSSSGPGFFWSRSEAASYDVSSPSVWAADITVSKTGSAPRTSNYFQAVAIQPSGTAFVVGNYPTNSTWSVVGLIKDPSSPSLTGALVEGSSPGTSLACLPTTVSGYAVPGMADGTSVSVSKSFPNGTSSNTASCSKGAVSLGADVPSCSIGYGWDGSVCQPSVTGVCWAANGVNAYSYPASGWCASGTKTDVDAVGSDGAFDWNCPGQFGGASASCSALKKIDGVCWTANGTKVASAPTINLCLVGSASAVSGGWPWSWTCSATNGGNVANCAAVPTYLDFTTPGTYTFTLPAGTTTFTAEGIGGGGGWAGGSDGGYSHAGPGGAGGWAGARSVSSLSSLPAGTYTVTVGGGGGGGGGGGWATTLKNPSGTVIFTASAGGGGGANNHCNDRYCTSSDGYTCFAYNWDPGAGNPGQASYYAAGGGGGGFNCWGSGGAGWRGAGGGWAGWQAGSCCGNTGWAGWPGFLRVTF